MNVKTLNATVQHDAERTTPTRIMVLHEPDGDIALDVSTPQRLENIALAIVRRRMERGYYPQPSIPVPPDIEYNAAKKLPAGKVRVYGLNLWAAYRSEIERYRREMERWEKIKLTVEADDGHRAIDVLTLRNDYEGESFKILEIRTEY